MTIDMQAHGWRKEEMGGHLLAWRRDVEGGYVIVTDQQNELSAPQNAPVWSGGRYLDNGEAYGWHVVDGVTLEEAAALAESMPIPQHGDEIID